MTHQYKSWPFQEAEKIIKANRGGLPEVAIFQTGYGPSGLPHIGTFAEVARTTWVMRAYEQLTGGKTKLIAFADDLDGLRKVPSNLPNQALLAEQLGKPLCNIPDPFGQAASFSGYMTGKLQEFLDRFGFKYHFQASSEAYRRGDFNDGLKALLMNVEKILDLILPTLKEENRKNWSPFMPICEKCGKVYTTHVKGYNKEASTIDYLCSSEGDLKGCGHEGTTTIFNGAVKMGWKIDWALRWYSYRVNYEMYGKDLIPSAELSQKIVKIMGGKPPVDYFYELFLDEEGHKISKSIGNGVSVDEWLAYAPVDSLSFFIFKNPRQPKKLYFDAIPKVMDEYLDKLRRYPDLAPEKKPDDDLWHIHNKGSEVPRYGSTINFTMVNNLVSALGCESQELLERFIMRYDEKAAEYGSMISMLTEKSMKFYEDHILPHKKYRKPSDEEKPLFAALRDKLVNLPEQVTENDLQTMVFEIAKAHNIEPKDFFGAMYQVLLGQERGPRFGSFASLVGIKRVIELIDQYAV
jgi:lysyl-tRNA synthetase class 1